jgi:putative addiction module component (TIGR02574 family)
MVNLKDILQLSSSERILIIEKIWDSINTQEIEVSQLQKQELDNRLSRIERGETKFYSWESIKKDLGK